MKKTRAKNKNKVLIIVFIIGVIMYAFIGFALLDKPNKTNVSSEQISVLETQIEELTQQSQEKDTKIANLNSQIGTLEDNNLNLQEENQDKSEIISSMQNELKNYNDYNYNIPVLFYVEEEYYVTILARKDGRLFIEPKEPYVYQKYFIGWSLDKLNTIQLSDLVITDVTYLYAVMIEDTTAPTFSTMKFGFVEALNYGDTIEKTGVFNDSGSGVEYWAYDFLGLSTNNLNWLEYNGTIKIIVDEYSLCDNLRVFAKDKAGNILEQEIVPIHSVNIKKDDVLNVKKLMSVYMSDSEIEEIENTENVLYEYGFSKNNLIYYGEYTSESVIVINDNFNGNTIFYLRISYGEEGITIAYPYYFYYYIESPSLDLPTLP